MVKARKPKFWWSSGLMVYIRAAELFPMISSFSLFLTAVDMISKNGAAAAATNYLCRLCIEIAAMDTMLRVEISICISCVPHRVEL